MVIVVAYGAFEAAVRVVTNIATKAPQDWSRRAIWLRFATWILLALEFALGADIIRTAVAPTWDDIGKLAAIAAIRTGLSYFLERDIESVGEPPATGGGAG
ncbi:DUF1622 domain-containing protein [Edaphosphingomonas haloaromaticamans]|uniref:DUF1622 domain-containing protein n=1 Tax=Edaphosphingomonas haloaromaticamans TaxID=653954 RepID=UPI0020C7AB35|nr:DUF1622 domain-containing protein [Sphingomonas haloaromaticamans]